MFETFREELKKVWKYASFWVMTIGMIIQQAWEVMPSEYKAQIITAVPLIGTIAPVAWIVAFVVARAVPQGINVPK